MWWFVKELLLVLDKISFAMLIVIFLLIKKFLLAIVR